MLRATWIEETMALPSLGMPCESFTLHFGGSPINPSFARYKLREAALVAEICLRYIKPDLCDDLSPTFTRNIRTWEMFRHPVWFPVSFVDTVKAVMDDRQALIKSNHEPDYVSLDLDLTGAENWAESDWLKRYDQIAERLCCSSSERPCGNALLIGDDDYDTDAETKSYENLFERQKIVHLTYKAVST